MQCENEIGSREMLLLRLSYTPKSYEATQSLPRSRVACFPLEKQ